MSCFIDDFQKHNATLFPKMSPFKVFNLVLISGTVLYFLLYVLTIGHLPHVPVVKIYFEEEPSEGDLAYFPRDFTHETSLNFGAGIMKDDGLNSSSTPELSVKDERASEELTGEKENSAKRSSLLSFLEGLGVPINKARILMASDISNNVLPRVNPNGFSLAKLMEKMDKEFNLENGTPCPTSHLNSVGLLAVYNNALKLEDVERELEFVQNGGQWKPDCIPRKKVAIVVPFRDRQEHLNIFVRHMHKYLRWQMLEYRIFIIEQADNERFNRGMLMNVGFNEAMKADNFTCVIFHDVDLIPEDARNDYSCPSSPRHMSTAVSRHDYILKYKTLFGGVEGFWVEHYRRINGFPNRFWGWGGEDDDLYVRITERRLSLTRPAHMIGRYTMLSHSHTEGEENPERHEELRRSEVLIDTDGLNTLAYTVIEFQEKPLYTLISVSLQ